MLIALIESILGVKYQSANHATSKFEKPILQKVLLGTFTFVGVFFGGYMLFSFSDRISGITQASYAFNQSALVTKSAKVVEDQPGGGPYGRLFVTMYNLELENGAVIENVYFFVPEPYLREGKNYELLMTPELDTIVGAREIQE